MYRSLVTIVPLIMVDPSQCTLVAHLPLAFEEAPRGLMTLSYNEQYNQNYSDNFPTTIKMSPCKLVSSKL